MVQDYAEIHFNSAHKGGKANQAQFHLQCSRRSSKVKKIVKNRFHYISLGVVRHSSLPEEFSIKARSARGSKRSGKWLVFSHTRTCPPGASEEIPCY